MGPGPLAERGCRSKASAVLGYAAGAVRRCGSRPAGAQTIGVNAMVVVGMSYWQTISGGFTARWLDAIVGALVALVWVQLPAGWCLRFLG